MAKEGSSDYKKLRKRRFFKERLTEWFIVESKMDLLWHRCEEPFKHLYFYECCFTFFVKGILLFLHVRFVNTVSVLPPTSRVTYVMHDVKLVEDEHLWLKKSILIYIFFLIKWWIISLDKTLIPQLGSCRALWSIETAIWTFNPFSPTEVHYMEKNPGMFPCIIWKLTLTLIDNCCKSLFIVNLWYLMH